MYCKYYFFRILSFCLVLLLLTSSVEVQAQGKDLPSPKSYFGFEMGADRKLAHWDDLVKYYNLLGEKSPRMKVVNMGKTTLGNPFLALYISAEDNLAKLEELKEINALLSDPRGATKEQIEQAIANGKAVVVQSFGLHSSEVAASQTAAEFTYDMLTKNDDETRRILDNTISIVIPCFNPDGEIMITEWYNKYVGTEYEGAGLPWLYHHYIGHDNNRDAFMLNTVESVYGAKIMFRDWVPQAYIDHHQMGAYGARLYVPPYSEPIRPDGDPLVWREMAWYGAHIAYKEEEADIAGVVNAAIFSGWGHFGFHWITPFHNIAGMLTESASATLATPLYVHPDQLHGSSRGMPEYEPQTSFPNPWPGGWWHVRDIVNQQKIAAVAVLDIAARNRETVLRNAYLKARRQTERGANGKTVAFIIPNKQHDPLTADKMVKVLLDQGIEVRKSAEEFTHEGKIYGAGTYVVSLAQPKRGVIRWLLGKTNYPDNDFTRYRDGSPIRPYDMSTDNIAEYMGVRVDPVATPVGLDFAKIEALVAKPAVVEMGRYGYLLDGKLNDSFTAVNLLLNNKVEVKRVDKTGNGVNAGDFIVPATANERLVNEVAKKTGVEFKALITNGSSVNAVKRWRIGMYQRYLGGNIDEGWTRLLLEKFGFPYTTLRDKDIQSADLRKKYDVIILPDDNADRMTGKNMSPDTRRWWESYPPEYRSGFGQAGIDALKAFVEQGGTLLTLGQAGELPIKEFNVPVRNVVEKVSSNEFWSPGSTLKLNIDNENPLAFGMPKTGLALFLGNNDVYQIIPTPKNDQIERIATFVDRDLMASGWLVGEDVIADKAAMVSVKMKKGRIIMIGFRPQHRVQTHGTFKLVFNALIGEPN
jgi:zinc carboxypeptidase